MSSDKFPPYYAEGYGNPYFPYSNRWKGQHWPKCDPRVAYWDDRDPDNTYMSNPLFIRPRWPEPTNYVSWGKPQYRYIDPPKKYYGTAACFNGQVTENKCAPGLQAVCKSDLGTQATCLNPAGDRNGNCDYGQNDTSSVWSASNVM